MIFIIGIGFGILAVIGVAIFASLQDIVDELANIRGKLGGR